MDGVRVLLIEDDNDQVMISKKILSKLKNIAKIDIARDGRQAIDCLFSTPSGTESGSSSLPNIIFADLNMPVCNGFEILTILKENEATKDIPVVVLTTSSEQQDIDQCYQLGAYAYLSKPLNLHNLKRVMSGLGLV